MRSHSRFTHKECDRFLTKNSPYREHPDFANRLQTGSLGLYKPSPPARTADREKYTINSEGELFDFNGGELIGVSGFRGFVDDFKEYAVKELE
jgi:hypothetical protein